MKTRITIDPAGGEGVNSHIEKTRVFVVSFRGQESSFGTFSPIGKRIYCSCHAKPLYGEYGHGLLSVHKLRLTKSEIVLSWSPMGLLFTFPPVLKYKTDFPRIIIY